MSTNSLQSQGIQVMSTRSGGTNKVGNFAAGTADQTLDTVRLQELGFNSVDLYVGFGTIAATAVTSIKLQVWRGSGNWVDFRTLTVPADGDNRWYVVRGDDALAEGRYTTGVTGTGNVEFRAQILRGTANAEVLASFYVLYNSWSMPYDLPASSAGFVYSA